MPNELSEEGRLAIDRLLIEQGMLSGLDQIDHMMDSTTLATLKDMEKLQAQAYRRLDFELVSKL